MKGLAFTTIGVCAGGAALFAGADSPDFDRVIHRPPHAVYAAFSSLGPEGTSGAMAGDFPEEMTAQIEKERDRSIRYALLVRDNPVLEIELNFEPAGDGSSTRMTAELDIDKLALGQLAATETGVALALVPDSFFDSRFAEMMEEMAKDVEAGRSPGSFGARSAGVEWRRSGSATSVESRRAQAEGQRRRAAEPMVRPEPMVDPNRAARDYLNGR